MHDRVRSFEIGKIEEVNQKLKDRFEYYKARLSEFEGKSACRIPKLAMPVPGMNLESKLKSSVSYLDSLKREKSLIESNQIRTLQELESQRKLLETRLNILRSENNSLKFNSKAKSGASKITEKEEAETWRSKIQDLENTHKKNQEMIRDLQSAQKRLKKKQVEEENPEEKEEDEETKELKKLQKAESHLQNIIRSNENKYKQVVKDLELALEKLSNDKVVLQMKILKTTQQERLLQMTIEQGDSEWNDRSFADANFLYKPTLKGLYH